MKVYASEFVETPILYIVVPCFNEESVLPTTHGLFLEVLDGLICTNKVSSLSRVLFVNDGSKDNTWNVIKTLSENNEFIEGMTLSRNRGHQNALLAGLMMARGVCDIAISIDCDGQDDPQAMYRMVDEYLGGSDVVYGVREGRDTDTFFKRASAEGFYRLLSSMGVEAVFNHADYRLMSKRALDALSEYKEVNLFLRGMVPLVGFRSSCVYYDRKERVAGESHYPLGKMVSLAVDGITSLSVKPIRFITCLGFVVSFLSFIGVIWAVLVSLFGDGVAGWPSLVSIICLVGGIQLASLGIIGEYVGKIYLESKRRPRYIVSDVTWGNDGE